MSDLRLSPAAPRFRRTTLRTPGIRDSLRERLEALQPQAARRWGTMPVGGMLCHLGDAFALMLTPVDGARAPLPWAGRALVRPLALGVPLRWPRNLPTVPVLDQRTGGRPPGEFYRDRDRVVKLLERFAATDEFRELQHPIFGPLTEWEWMRWAWLHTDHHLRQFSA